MKDQNKTKDQLIVELEKARQRISELEQPETERGQAEQALRESEERYRDLFEMVPVCLWEEDFSKLKRYVDELRLSGVTDLGAYFQAHPEDLGHCASLVEIIDVNQATVQLSGGDSKEQLLGNLDKLFIDESYKNFQNEIIALYERGGVFQGENVNVSLQGKLLYSEINGKIAAGYEDTWGKYLVAQMDITKRKQVELELRESEERFRTIFDTEPECVKILNPDTTLVTMNPAGLAMIEAESQDMVKGQSMLPVIDEEFRDDFQKLTNNVCKKGQSGMLEFRITGLKGTPRWLETHGVPLRDVEGAVRGLLGITRDITGRKQAEASVHAFQERFKIFFNSLNDAIFVHPLMDEGFAPFIEVNEVACKRYGYSRDEMLKLTAVDITKKTDVEDHSAPSTRKKLLKARHLVFETVHIKKSGEEFPVEINANIVDEHGHPVILAVVRDITMRKKSEQVLQKQEAELQSIFRAAPIGIGMTLDRVIQEANRTLCQMTGYAREELIGQSARILYPSIEEYEHVGDEKYRMIKEQGIGTVETHWMRKDGTVRDILLSSVPLDPGDLSKRVTFSALDITERIQAESAVKESEERYRNIVESSPLGIHMYELQAPKRLVFGGSNPAADEILGVDNSIFVGKTIEDAFPPLADSEVPERYKMAAAKGIPWKTEQIDYDADGIKGAFEVVAFQTSPGKMVAMFQDITTRKQAEDALRTKTGELETLFSISKHLRAARSADDMLPLVVREMHNVLGADAGAIILLDPDSTQFRYACADGALEANMGKKFAAEKSISGMVFRTNKPYLTEDLSSDTAKATGLMGAEELGPAVVVPLMSEEDFLGVLVCARAKDESSAHFSESEVQLLTAVGEMVGNALRRTGLYDQALTRLQNVQALRSIDVAISANMELSAVLDILLAQGSAQLDFDAASVLLLNPHTHTFEYEAGYGFRTKAVESVQLRVGEGLPGQVALKRNTLYVPDLLKNETLLRKKLLDEGFVSYQAAPLIAKGQLRGVLEMFSRTLIVVNDEKTAFLETLATQAAIAIDNAHLFINLQRSNFELGIAYDATIEGWSRALELRDQETEGHTLRVADLTVRLAHAMGVRGEEIVDIRRGALLHDIGKMGVPDRILLKPGKLDDEEWDIMKQHTVYAFEMLWPIEFLRLAIDIPHCHHERWDGTGYPRGLKGEQIPLSARIFAIVDVWDALNSNRPYRKAWTEDKALDYITANAGKHFDPRVVEHFLNFLNNIGQSSL